MTRRKAVLAGAAALGVCAAAAPAAPPTAVLFVCRAGTVKSPIARELMRAMAAARGLLVQARSRGIAPVDHLSPQLAAALARDGIDTMREPVRALSLSDLAWADIIVVFDELPLAFGVWRVRDWSDTASMNENYPRARAQLTDRIARLLDDVAALRATN